MRRKSNRSAQPTITETRVLRQIAQGGGLICTFVLGDQGRQYSTASGVGINTATAERLIDRGWLVGDDADALFGARPQRYRTLLP